MKPTIINRVATLTGVAAFVYLSSTIMVMASERVYWYWAGLNWESILFIGSFYLIPVGGALWAMARAHATSLHHIILGGAIFAFLVEGVLTPIIYSDGVLVVFAALFTGWHGVIALVGFWYLGRTWLVQRRTKRLAAVAGGFGALWGVWALAASIGDSDAAIEGVYTSTIDPTTFAVYAFGVGATLASSHWLIGKVWPKHWRPTKWSTILLGITSVAYMALAVLVVVPWAPIKLSVLLGGTYWLATRGKNNRLQEVSIFDQLSGTVRARDVAVIFLMPLAATATYWATWTLQLSDDTLEIVFFIFNSAQILGGASAFIWAATRSLKERKTPVPPAAAATIPTEISVEA